jgi:AmmeMemoRadiSam system protein B/AmmeMemoRadiSam system protein A
MTVAAQQTLRPPAVAGTFYPADAAALDRFVGDALAPCPALPSRPLAVIAPHAGLRYSGRLAARALAAARGWIGPRVVVLSPAHRHAFDGIALPSQDGFALPGGVVAVDRAARADLLGVGLARTLDAAHDREHGIEVLLPFLRQLAPQAQIVPLVIGRASPAEVAAVIDRLAGQPGAEPLFVLSSDLSHFLPLGEAQAMDAGTARMIETGQAGALTPSHACGSKAVAGFLISEAGLGARLLRLGMANSHAVSGDAARTVGYGAWAIAPGTAALLDESARGVLLAVARQALEARLRRGRTPKVRRDSFPPELQTHMASFVTLKRQGRLRGCIGSIGAHRSLIADVVENAVRAGLADRRFPPLAADELASTEISLALLSPARPMHFASQADLERQLVPGRDGLVLTEGDRRGVFLPMVWDALPGPGAFLNGLKVKAGLPETHWSKHLRVARFHAEAVTAAGGDGPREAAATP